MNLRKAQVSNSPIRANAYVLVAYVSQPYIRTGIVLVCLVKPDLGIQSDGLTLGKLYSWVFGGVLTFTLKVVICEKFAEM